MKRELVKYNENCGICLVKDEKTQEEWNIIFGFFMKQQLRDDKELGECIGKGKSETEALTDAVKNLLKYIMGKEHFREEFEERVREFSYFAKLNPLGVIMPIDEYEYKDSNAQVFLEDDGTCYLGLT